jgi:hypothetical protein
MGLHELFWGSSRCKGVIALCGCPIAASCTYLYSGRFEYIGLLGFL